MKDMFHKNELLNDADAAWFAYKKSPSDFSFPERITVELTNRCNLACFMCPRNNVKMDLGDIEIELFKKIINEASSHLPICLVPFFRGESLLHPRFLEMLSYAKEKGLNPIQLATNAYFLNERLQKGILDLEIDFISFSVDTNMPEIYKKIRKNSDFERVYGNIVSFINQKEKLKKHLPIVQISAVKTKENTEFINEFIEFWKQRLDRVRIYYPHSLDGKLGSLDIKCSLPDRKPCLKLLTDVVVYWNGDVAVCNHDWCRKEFIGNVKNESIEKIWQDNNYKRIRERHLGGRYLEEPTCQNCEHWTIYYDKNCIIGELYSRQ